MLFMTAEIIFGSNKLGLINDKQLQSVLDKFKLGKLISSKSTDEGAMGQTMFVSSTEGEYVLKGNPLYSGQFMEEKFFIDNVNSRTNIPVPRPYIIDDSEDIFGWNYVIMPCLKGEHLNSKPLQIKLQLEDKLKIAESIAEALTSFHTWKVNDFGELDPKTLTIIPFKNTYSEWLFKRILFWVTDAKKYSRITDEDLKWVHSLLAESEDDFNHISSPSFVMGDFKPGNFLIYQSEHGWEISGVFDFTNSYFADPVSDFIKMITYYIDNNETDIAKHFINTYYKQHEEEKNSIRNRIKVHMLHQKTLDWGSAKATNTVTWDNALPFSEWAVTYTTAAEKILE